MHVLTELVWFLLEVYYVQTNPIEVLLPVSVGDQGGFIFVSPVCHVYIPITMSYHGSRQRTRIS